jgi:hypothetical protein
MNDAKEVRFWHEADLPRCPLSVAFEGKADISQRLPNNRDL